MRKCWSCPTKIDSYFIIIYVFLGGNETRIGMYNQIIKTHPRSSLEPAVPVILSVLYCTVPYL